MKIVKYFFFASLLALGACGDDDNNKDLSSPYLEISPHHYTFPDQKPQQELFPRYDISMMRAP